MHIRISSSSIIIFDIGQVLVEFDTALAREYLYRYLNNSPGKKTYFPKDIVQAYERGFISDYKFYREVSRAMSLVCSYRQFFYGWNKMFIQPVEGIEEILKNLSRTYKLLALSNTSPSHIRYLLQRFKFFRYFQDILTSYQFGVLKPDILIYKKVEEKHFPGRKPLLYIDDLRENVMAAKSVGWPSYQFRGADNLKNILKERDII